MAGASPPPGTGRWAVVAVVVAFVLVGAGVLLQRKRPEPIPVRVEPAVPEQPIAFYLARADATRGEAQFARCAGCHRIERDAPHGVGPNLWGVIGARIATRPDYLRYSPALGGQSGRWDWETASRFLRDPRAFAPGTRMTFGGMRDPQQRADLLVFMNSRGGSLTPPAPAR